MYSIEHDAMVGRLDHKGEKDEALHTMWPWILQVIYKLIAPQSCGPIIWA